MPCEEMLELRKLDLFSLKKRWFLKDITATPSASGEGISGTEPGFLHQCMVEGYESVRIC